MTDHEHVCAYCGASFRVAVPYGGPRGSWMGRTLQDHYMVCSERRRLQEQARHDDLLRRRRA